ncbi:unnamed protein product [Aphis gossypii]|uniref:Uncharacterized protein n=1 Tax=Aphis gossypii TaxID=80765 RepID=A0A9P0ISY8_APHGO|nr:unnamed protein product [Aphis gossypii]
MRHTIHQNSVGTTRYHDLYRSILRYPTCWSNQDIKHNTKHYIRRHQIPVACKPRRLALTTQGSQKGVETMLNLGIARLLKALGLHPPPGFKEHYGRMRLVEIIVHLILELSQTATSSSHPGFHTLPSRKKHFLNNRSGKSL